MLYWIYLIRNLTRNIRRTLLTSAAVALPIVIFVLSTSVISALNSYLDNAAKQMRLIVTHKTSFINPLPSGYRYKIEALDPERKELTAVCGMHWLGGKVENDPRLLSTLAVDKDNLEACYPDYHFTQEEMDAWHRDRQAAILGPETAKQFGWKLGDRITITPSLPPYTPMEFHVISTAEHASDPVTSWIRLDYYFDALKEHGFHGDEWIGFFVIKCNSIAGLDHYRRAIDELFANYPDPTKTRDEKSFVNEFIAQQFNLPRNLAILASLTVFVAIMAAMNTMSMNIRDRINEVATMKSLGFSSRSVFVQILIESMMLCVSGGFVGALIPYGLFHWTPLGSMTIPVIQALDIPLLVCMKAVLIAVGIGILSALWPAWLGAKLNVVTALRYLE